MSTVTSFSASLRSAYTAEQSFLRSASPKKAFDVYEGNSPNRNRNDDQQSQRNSEDNIRRKLFHRKIAAAVNGVLCVATFAGNLALASKVLVWAKIGINGCTVVYASAGFAVKERAAVVGCFTGAKSSSNDKAVGVTIVTVGGRIVVRCTGCHFRTLVT